MDSGDVPQAYWKRLYDFIGRIGATDPVNTQPSNFQRMSDEDRRYLERAMAEYVKDTDPVRQMKQNLEVLSRLDSLAPSDEEKVRGVSALEDLQDLCAFLDNATAFLQIGGLKLLPLLLASHYAGFRREAASLIGELVQNHESCQNKLVQLEVMPALLEMVDGDPDETVRQKALFAISCMVRDNDSAVREFVGLGGFDHVLRGMQCDGVSSRFQTKAAFFIASLASKPELKEILSSMGMVDQLAGMLRSFDIGDPAAEQTLSALDTLTDGFEQAVAECQRDQFDLRQHLESRLDRLNTEENSVFEEEKAHVQNLLRKCWPPPSNA